MIEIILCHTMDKTSASSSCLSVILNGVIDSSSSISEFKMYNICCVFSDLTVNQIDADILKQGIIFVHGRSISGSRVCEYTSDVFINSTL